MVFFGEVALRNAVREFLIHYHAYHAERNHQGLDNRLIESGHKVNCATDYIACRERLRGMLRYNYRRAASVHSILCTGY
jgi:hypothetical protein